MRAHLKVLLACFGIILGIISGLLSPLSTELFILGALGTVVSFVVYVISLSYQHRSQVAIVTSIVLFCFCVGIVRTQLIEEKSVLSCETTCSFKGEIISLVEEKDDKQVIVIQEEGGELYDVMIRVPLYPAFQKGDTVSVEGSTKKVTQHYVGVNQKVFDYENFLLSKGIGSQMMYPKVSLVEKRGNSFLHRLYSFRDALHVRVVEMVQGVEGVIASGMLLGSATLYDDEKELFRIAGLSHIIVLSGFNISILIIALFVILRMLPVPLRVIASLFVIAIFIIMVEGGISVIRAALMSFVALTAFALGKRYFASQALLLSAIAIVIYSPPLLLYDVSFHLSFLATAGIIYLYDMIHTRLYAMPELMRTVVATTVAAYISTTPYLIYTFESLSTYSVIANIFVVPLVPIAMLMTLITVVVSYVSLSFATVFGFLTSCSIALIVAVSKVISMMPFATISLSIGLLEMSIVYLSIILVYVFLVTRTNNETTETKQGETISSIISF
ncbi:MAG: hypothetical protein RI935_248 [Candidatus Parcubacteria bacterium]|jgi:competence protein ComEC